MTAGRMRMKEQMSTTRLLLALSLLTLSGCEHSEEAFSWSSLTAAKSAADDRLELADDLFLYQVRLDELWAAREVPYVRAAVTEEALVRMRDHLELCRDLLQHAAAGSSVDPELVRSARMGRVLAGFAHDLVSLQVGASRESPRLSGEVMAEVNHGLAWVWMGMKELHKDPNWGIRDPNQAYQVLYWAQKHRDNVQRVLPVAYVAKEGVQAALIVSTAHGLVKLAKAGPPALARVVEWMRGAGRAGGVLALVGSAGSGAGVQILTAGGGLVLTDAEVIALAEAGQLSATALSLYVLARNDVHHVATDKNTESDRYGGPWTQRFQKYFDDADMSFDDPANLVEVEGHVGPHPEAYHQEVIKTLRDALRGLKAHTPEYREALRRTLKELGRRCATPGTRLNLLLRRVITE